MAWEKPKNVAKISNLAGLFNVTVSTRLRPGASEDEIMADVIVTVGRGGTDNLSPSISWDSPADGTTVTNWATLTWTATDETALSRIVPVINGVEQPPIYYPDPQILVVPDPGPVTVTTAVTASAIAYDVAGNSAHTANRTITIVPDTYTPPSDTVAPVVTQTSPISGTTLTIGSSGNILWGGSATDAVGVDEVYFYRNGVQYGQPAAALGATSISPAVTIDPNVWGAGTYNLHMTGVDEALNVGTSSTATLVISIDTNQPPTISWNSPADGATQTGTLLASWTATDDVALDRVVPVVNGTPQSPIYTDPPQDFSYPIGGVTVTTTYSVSATAYDEAGKSTNSSTRTITVVPAAAPPSDTIAPVVTHLTPTTGTTVTVGDGVSWSGSATDAGGLVSMQPRLDGANYGTPIPVSGTSVTVTTTLNTSSLSIGNHTLGWQATDVASNVGSSSTATLNVAAPPATPPSPPTEALFTPPSGTALFNVYPDPSDVVANTYTTFRAQFIRGTVTEAERDQLFYCASNGGAASYVQCDNHTVWPQDGSLHAGTLTLKTPASGWVPGTRLTIFKSATESVPSAPTIAMTDSTFTGELRPYTQQVTVVGISKTQPSKTISSITNANPGVVTTTTPHGYVNGASVNIAIQYATKHYGIQSMSKANPCVITFVSTHALTNGEVMYFTSSYGPAQLVGSWPVTVIDSTRVSIPADSTGWADYPGHDGAARNMMMELIGTTHTVANVTTNTFELQGVNTTNYSAYVPPNSGWYGTCRPPDFRVGDEIDLSIDDGLTVETYNTTVIDANNYNQNVALYRLSEQIDASSTKYRTSKWSDGRDSAAFSGNYGPGPTSRYGTFGSYQAFTWAKSNAFVGNKDFLDYYMFPIFTKATPDGENPRTFTATLTMTAGAPNSIMTETVRTAVNRGAAITWAWDTFGAAHETWKDGRLVKETWKQGLIGYGGMRLLLGLRKDRDGNVVKRMVMMTHSDATNTAREEMHYDFVINGGGSELYKLNDAIHTPFLEWHWPLLDSKITIVDKAHAENCGMIPKLYSTGFSYNQASITNQLRCASWNESTYWPVPLSEVGTPLLLGGWDVGSGVSGGPANTSWAFDVEAYAIIAWRHDAVKYASVYGGNAHGAIAYHVVDPTGVGALANGPIDPHDLTKRRWQLRVDGDNGLAVSSGYDQFPGCTTVPQSKFYLRCTGGVRRGSHGVGGGFLGMLITGEYRYFRNLEHSLQESILQSGYSTHRPTGSNTTYSSNGVYLFPTFANGYLRGVQNYFGEMGRMYMFVPKNHARRAFWVNICANLLDVFTKSIDATDGLALIPDSYAQPSSSGVEKAQPIISAGATGHMWAWHLGYVMGSIGYYARSGADYTTLVDKLKDSIGLWEQAPLTIEGAPYVRANQCTIVLCDQDASTATNRNSLASHAAIWTEYLGTANLQIAGERTGTNPTTSLVSMQGQANQPHNYTATPYHGLRNITHYLEEVDPTTAVRWRVVTDYMFTTFQNFLPSWGNRFRVR